MKPAWLTIRIVALVAAAIGIWLLLQSAQLGTRAADAVLIASGGGMDANRFAALTQGSISAYRWLGIVITALGLYRATEGLGKQS